MKLFRILAGVVALLFVFGPALMYAAGVRPAAFENRKLAAAPDPGDGWVALDALAPWATDHLPGRKDAVRANAWIDFFVLGSLPAAGGSAPVSAASGSAGAVAAPPMVIRGKNRMLFLGEDFSIACRDNARFEKALKGMARLAALVEESGRRAVFLLGPNKSSVATDDLPEVLPGGECAGKAIAAQNRVMDGFDDQGYVNLRSDLAKQERSDRGSYWETDTHWSSVGSAQVARAIAEKLDPELATSLRTTESERSKVGDLTLLAGLSFEERSPATQVSTGGKVRETKASDHWTYRKPVYGIHQWTTAPSDGLIPGRTTIVGDSFTYFALDNLRPLFASGQFLWVGTPASPEQVIDSIVGSDTVVFESVQRGLVGNALYERAFYEQVQQALEGATR